MSRRTRSAAARTVTAVARTRRSANKSTPSPAVNTNPTPIAAQSLPICHFERREAWEAWLETNHQVQVSGLWLKISKKGSGIASVTYDEALDAALCFGWIDGHRKSHDEQHFIQRFTPRRKNSLWSRRNVDKVATLAESGRMRSPGQAEVDAAKADGRWERAYAGSSSIQVPSDFQTALDGNKSARTFFDALGKTQRYSFLWRIETTKRPETRQRKILQFVELLAACKTL